MEEKDRIMISAKYVASDFLNIKLKLESPNGDWEKAIKIFEDRFIERYFDPIDLLIKNPKLNGFAIMALNCLLVETFYQFEKGFDKTTNNREEYVSFLMNNLSCIVTSKNMANHFYKDIRCGILHSAETKNGSILSIDSDIAIESIEGKDSIKVNVSTFSKKIKEYFQSYILKLRTADNNKRENFIKKMNYICNG